MSKVPVLWLGQFIPFDWNDPLWRVRLPPDRYRKLCRQQNRVTIREALIDMGHALGFVLVHGDNSQ